MKRRYELPGMPTRTDGLDTMLHRRVSEAIRQGVRAGVDARAGVPADVIGADAAPGSERAAVERVGPRPTADNEATHPVPSYDRHGRPVHLQVTSADPAEPPVAGGQRGGGGPGNAPWVGTISAPWNAALRREPHRDRADPYSNIVADLPHGSRVTIVGEDHGWLRARVVIGGRQLTGYVSPELVSFERQQTAPSDVTAAFPSFADPMSSAFAVLKRAQARYQIDPGWHPSPQERQELGVWANVLEMDHQYTVDRSTYRVAFAQNMVITVTSIDDFIQFVETLEEQYPQATAEQIAGELRQLWFGGGNWQLLLDSPGITEGNAAVELRDRSNPMASRFDLEALRKQGRVLTTPLGNVDISHVMAGIDAALNGAAREPGSPDLRWTTLHAADEGDPRDFATWAGDLGQAYAEYLERRYVEEEAGAQLSSSVRDKASTAQLLGDIHGYIAVDVWRRTPANLAMAPFVSDILRSLYLEPPSTVGGPQTYQRRLEQLSGTSAAELRELVVRRTLAFARVWFANAIKSSLGLVLTAARYARLDGESGALQRMMADFDTFHARNQATANSADRLDFMIDLFMELLGSEKI